MALRQRRPTTDPPTSDEVRDDDDDDPRPAVPSDNFQEQASAAALRVGTGGVALTCCTLLGCASRLWNLQHPATPVYDETHVGRFLNWYADGAFFFDVHGPLAKLLMYWTATALGYEGRASCPYESTDPYAAQCTLAPQRLVPALCGAAMVPLTFATCCAMRLHPLAALLASWFVLVDTLWIGVSRIHLNDMVLMLCIAVTHLLALAACDLPRAEPRAAGRSRAGVTALLVATGVALGCALQCKYAMALTTLGWLGLQNLHTLGRCLAEGRGAATTLREAAARGALLLGIPAVMHLALLRLHLSYLPKSGNGDSYMSPAFQATLVGNAHNASVPSHERLPFWRLALEHTQTQFWYNRNMAVLFPRGSHPFDTAWHTWPLAGRGVYFNLVRDWQAIASDIERKHTFGFFLHPNPAITLLTTGVAALAAFALAYRLFAPLRASTVGGSAMALGRIGHELRPGGSGSLLVAYLIHWLPYATQSRQTFLLYYLPAYYFAILLTARAWHAVGCAYLRPPVALVATLGLCAATGHLSWQISPIAFASAVRLPEWTSALRLASTECWRGAECWVSAQ